MLNKDTIMISILCSMVLGCFNSGDNIPRQSLEVNISRGPTHLENASLHYDNREYEAAIESFLDAIVSDGLNNAGRALSYWNIAECWGELGNEDQMIEALFTFSLVAQDVIDERDRIRYTVTSDGDFIEKFELEDKLNFARARINFAWALRSNFGRSRENPIVVYNVQELGFFVKIVKSQCSGECEIQRGMLHRNGILVQPHTERIIVNQDQFFVVMP